MKKSLTLAIVAMLALFAAPKNLLAQTHWTAGGANLNWGDAGNWSSGTPNNSILTYFEDGLYPNAGTNASSLVNNIVDANHMAGGLAFTSLSGPTGPVNHHFTTLIPSGVILTLGGLGSSGPVLAVGDVPGSGQWVNAGSFTNYSTITGTGELLINDSASVMSVGFRNRATLNLTGLNTFSGSFKQLLVGSSADNPNSTGPTGWLLLGKTNTVTTTANLTAPGILIGSAIGGNCTGVVALGGTNIINTDGFVIGGRRATSTVLTFGGAYSNTVTAGNFILRGSAGGSSRVSTFSVGDLSAQPADYLAPPVSSATGTADFSGGTVDIRADSIYVGRSAPDTGTASGTTYGFGTLILERGSVDVNNLRIAYKQGTNGSTAVNYSGSIHVPNTLILKSNVQMTVNQDVTMAFRNNGTYGAANPFGLLAVNDNAVINIAGNITTPTNGNSILQLGGGTVNMTGSGNITNMTLAGSGSIAGANNITVVSNLVPGGATSAGTLNLGGNLNFMPTLPVTFDLGTTNTIGAGINDHLNVTGDVTFNSNPVSFTYGGPLLPGSNYTVITYTGSKTGSLTFTNDTRSELGLDQSTAGQVSLVVTNWNPATLTWQGTAVTNMHVWRASLTNLYWTNNAGGAADRFYQGDAVVFNDTAINPIVYPDGLLFPASIVVDCTSKHIMITNRNTGAATGLRGVIAGNCSFTKNGPGTFTFGTYSNAFTGPINVNNGVWRLFDPNFSTPANMPTLGSTLGTMYVNSGATFDFFGVGSTSPGKPVVINGVGYGGLGALTNGSTSGSVQGFAVTLAGDSTVSAQTGPLGLRSTIATAPPFSGYLNLNGYTLTKLGANRFSLQDVVATNSGSINVVAGNLAVANCIIEGPGSINLSNSTYLSLGIQSTLSTVGYVAKTLNVYTAGLLSPASGGSAAPTAIVNSAVNLLGPLSITNAQPIAMNGIIDGAANLIKYGNSNLLLNAANTYSGQTLINAGTLTLGAGGSINNSSLISIPAGVTMDVTAKAGTYAVAPAQTLNLNGTLVGDATVSGGGKLLGSGVINGSLTLAAGSETALATTNVTGTMVVSNNLTLNDAHLTWEFAPSFDISDALVVGGNLSLTGTNRFTISSIGGFDPSGTNTLITYTGTLNGGLTNLALDTTARFVVEFVDPATTPGAIKLRLITPSPLMTWKGGDLVNPQNWDNQISTNWDNASVPDVFYPSDEVRFDDSANTNVVRLVGTIGPASISMENSTLNYFIGGNGSLVSSSLTNGSGSLTLSNTANNFFTGVGLVLNSGSLTMAQPSNSTLTANLNGGGTFNKAATSTLTLIGNAANYNGALNVNAGTLRAGNSNVLGVGSTTVASGGTLDINGQFLGSPIAINIAGNGADGFGALNNRGAARTNAVGNVTLAGDASVGALSNNWGIFGTVTGNNFALAKTNLNDVWIQSDSDTGLGNIDIRQGRLIFARSGTTLGNVASNITVRPGATLGLAATNILVTSGFPPLGIDAGIKPIILSNNAAFESVSFGGLAFTNTHGGPITLNTNGIFKVGKSALHALNGPISGIGNLILTNNGTLLLTGTNTYTSNTFVYSGTLMLNNARSLPTNSIVNVSNVANSFTSAGLHLAGNLNMPSNITLRLSSANGSASLSGDGVWNGPISMWGSNTFSFSGGDDGLDLVGPYDTTKAGGTIQFGGGRTRVRNSISFPGTVQIPTGPGSLYDINFTTVRFDKTNNWSSMPDFGRGRIILGTDNALPPSAPINSLGYFAGGDLRTIIDLNGYNQTVSSIAQRPSLFNNSYNQIANDSTTSDSRLTYAGTGLNTWTIRLYDNVRQNLVRFNAVFINATNSGDYTLGYEFIPTNNIRVIRFRHVFGTKMSIWTAAGVLVASQDVTNTPLNFVETPLTTPVTLTAGTTYRIAAYTDGGDYYTEDNSGGFIGRFHNGTIGGSFTANGDAFPSMADSPTNLYPMDMIYTEGSGKLGLTVSSGVLETGATNNYTGTTLVTGGKLLVARFGSDDFQGFRGAIDGSDVTVSGTGSFGGNGYVNGNVTVNAGGTLTPGERYDYWGNGGALLGRVGDLRLGNDNLTFNAGSTALMEVDLVASTNDMVVGINTLTLGGTLVVSNIAAQPFTNGTVLQLFSAASYVAGPVSVLPNSPGDGLMWDTTDLAVNGTLKVVPAVAPVIADVTRLGDGNFAFSLTGTVGQGYSVRATTNITLPLVSWPVIQSGTLTSSPLTFTDLTATNYPARYYRASTP